MQHFIFLYVTHANTILSCKCASCYSAAADLAVKSSTAWSQDLRPTTIFGVGYHNQKNTYYELLVLLDVLTPGRWHCKGQAHVSVFCDEGGGGGGGGGVDNIYGPSHAHKIMHS